MSVIDVRYVNTAFVRFVAEPGIMNEISDFFSYEMPGAKFSPAYKNRHWDGIVRLANQYSGILPAGLLDYLSSFADQRGYKMQVDDLLTPPTEEKMTYDEAKDFICSLKPRSGDTLLEPHKHQVDAFCHAINKSRSVLLSPTASGKSLIIYSLCRYYQNVILPTRKILIIVPTISLVAQMYSDFDDYSNKSAWSAHKNCHKISGGATKLTDRQIVCATWQSIYKMPRAWFDNFEVVIGDEAHLQKAKSLTAIMHKLVDCPYRTGLTGTLDGTNIHKLVIEGSFGPVTRVISTRELMEKDLLSTLQIECLLMKYPKELRETLQNMTYQQEIDWIVTCEKRNRFIAQLASVLKGNTLVLFQFVEKHGKPLFEMIKAAAPAVIEGRKVFFVAGETDVDDRESIRHIAEKEQNAIIVGSYGVWSTGTNLKSLKNIVFASPSKSRIRILQSIGRQLRKSEHKDKAKLYDIGDDLHWGSESNYTLKHFASRLKLYDEEGFPYRVSKLPIFEKKENK